MKLRDVGEDRLLERLLSKLRSGRRIVLGPGDDCALVDSGKDGLLDVLKTDCLVEEIHFAKTTSPALVGWKAMARPLSDFAAMSAVPRFALVTLIVPSDRELSWVQQLYRGIEKAGRRFGVSVVGGETSNIKGPTVVSLSVTGFVEKKRWVGRGGGKLGDDLFVTGRLGGSLRGQHLKFVPRIAESRWLTENFPVHAMMDLSDGLGSDLPRLARASGLGFEVEEAALPRNRGCSIAQAISDGEDYELLFAIPPKNSLSLMSRWQKKFPTVRLTRIGRLANRNSKFEIRKFPRGYVHFQKL
ncbi:MAG TPA: thiamine-phosphate kinase [Chthoniobacterales bacterium]|jgi:thiamine-monophosphate kinase|nr:thiamine-phosphate kinase [Chthoniobacterales bacterium]